MGRGRVVTHAAARGPFQGEVANRPAQQLVIRPASLRHHGRRETRLVRQHLKDRDLGLAVGGEFRDVLRDGVGKAQQPVLDQHPDGSGGNHLGIRIHQEQRTRIRRLAETRLAEALEQRQLAVPGDGQLRAGLMALGDVLLDDSAGPGQLTGIEAKCLRVRFRQRKGHGVAPRGRYR